MSIRLNDFLGSSSAAYFLNKASQQHQRVLSQLSSGSRITETQDDSAGFAVAFKFGSEIKRLDGAVNNLQNAKSFLQTQEGAFNTATSVLSRMIELTTLAQDVTKNSSDISTYNLEFQQLSSQLKSLNDEKFNSIRLFVEAPENSTAASISEELLSIPVSDDTSQNINLSRAPLITNPWMNMILKGFVSFDDPSNSQRRIFVPNPPQDLKGYLADGSEFDLDQSATVTQHWTSVANVNTQALPATIGGNPTIVNALVPVGSNPQPVLSPYVTNPTYRQFAENIRTGQVIDPLYLGTTNIVPNTFNLVSSNPLATLNSSTQSGSWIETLEPYAGNPISGTSANVSTATLTSNTAKEMGAVASLALQSLSEMRSKNGAEESGIQSRIDSMQSRIVGLDHARSEIQDTDVAKAVGELSRTNILMQSASSMLTQANNLNRDMILRLLS